MNPSIKITGIKQTVEMLQKKQTKARNVLRNLSSRLETATRRLIRDNFRNESSAEGEAWKPLSPKYLIEKKEKGGGNKILVFDGQLRSAALHNGLQRISEDQLEVLMDTTEDYFSLHQFGGMSESGAYVPARPYFDVNQSDVDDKIAQIVDTFLMRE